MKTTSWPEVESLLVSRSLREMETAIQKRLRQEKKSVQSRLLASEYFRRASQFPKALHILAPLSLNQKPAKADYPSIIQTARILNLLGASSYALKTLEPIYPFASNAERAKMAPLYLSNFVCDRAAESLEFLLKHSRSDWDYSTRLQLLTLADSYWHLEKQDDAIELASEILSVTKEPLLMGILNQALGSYCISAEKIRKASVFLEKSATFFKETDTTVDFGLLKKWQGVLESHKGNFEKSDQLLREAFTILYAPGRKPEGWLGVLYWAGFNEWQKSRKLPKVWELIFQYPSPSRELKTAIKNHIKLPDPISTKTSPEIKNRIKIDLARNEMSVGRSPVRHSFGLALPESLWAHLTLAGKYGIPQYRIYDLLWPNDIAGFQQNQKRMEQVVLRTRKLGGQVEWDHLHLTALAPLPAVIWSPNRHSPSVIQPGEILLRKEVENYYQVSKAQASKLLLRWKKEGFLSEKNERL